VIMSRNQTTIPKYYIRICKKMRLFGVSGHRVFFHCNRKRQISLDDFSEQGAKNKYLALKEIQLWSS